VIRARDVRAELQRSGHTLKPLEIVPSSIRAPARRYGHDDFVSSGCGMGHEAPCICSSAASG